MDFPFLIHTVGFPSKNNKDHCELHKVIPYVKAYKSSMSADFSIKAQYLMLHIRDGALLQFSMMITDNWLYFPKEPSYYFFAKVHRRKQLNTLDLFIQSNRGIYRFSTTLKYTTAIYPYINFDTPDFKLLYTLLL